MNKNQRQRILKDKQSISTYTVNLIVDKWGNDEAIMNMASRIKELELENGILKSDLSELEEKTSNLKGKMQLSQEIKKLKKSIQTKDVQLKNQANHLSKLQYQLKVERKANFS